MQSIYNTVISKYFDLQDYSSCDFTLERGVVYLFMNTHITNFGEMILLSWWKENYLMKKIISTASAVPVNITHNGNGKITMSITNGTCRGLMYKFPHALSV